MPEIIYECDKCGHLIKPGVNFCANCGVELDWGEDGDSRQCPKCSTKVNYDDSYCPKCGTVILGESASKKKRKEPIKSKIDINLLDGLREYPYGAETVLFILCTAPFILAIAVLYEKSKLREKISDDEIIKRAKTIRRYCSWCFVFSIPLIFFIAPIIGINITYKIHKHADALIKNYEGVNVH